MEYQDYMDFCYKIKNKLREDVNGSIRFIVFENEDCATFTLSYKQFESAHLVANISAKFDYINNDDVVEEIVDTIKSEYKRNILNMYFKSPYKKKREEEWKHELFV